LSSQQEAAAGVAAPAAPKQSHQQQQQHDPALAIDAAAAVMSCSSVFDAVPAELEAAMQSLSLPSPPQPSKPQPPSSPSSQPPNQEAGGSIPARLLSSLPSYLLPSFLLGGGRGTFKPLKQHTVRSVHRFIHCHIDSSESQAKLIVTIPSNAP